MQKKCDDVFMESSSYNVLAEIFQKLLKDVVEILVSLGIDLSKDPENVIDNSFVKITEYRTSDKLEVYSTAISNNENYVDVHFRIAFYDAESSLYYHIIEIQVYENFFKRCFGWICHK